MTNLSEHQQKTINAFVPENKDIDLVVLYTRIYGDPGTLSSRDMQMKIAPTFRTINEKIAPDKRIEPGDIKRTYRLTITKG